MRTRTLAAASVAAGLTLAACADSVNESTAGAGYLSDDGQAGLGEGSDFPARLELDIPDPNTVYDPASAGEPLPAGYRSLLARDAIAPIYDPTFTDADGVDWPENSLVIGVDLGGETRAYPVGFLNRREIVNDVQAGIPTLVTW